MRAVVPAMRRSLMRLAMALASRARGARSVSRLVASTGTLALQVASRDPVRSDVITRAPGLLLREPQKRKGEPATRSPLYGTLLGPPVRLGYRQTKIWSSVYSAAASIIGTTDTKMRPLALVRNST